MGKKIDGMHDLIVVVERVIRLYGGLNRAETVAAFAILTGPACGGLLYFWAWELRALLHRCLECEHWLSIIATILFLLPALLIDASGLTERSDVGPTLSFIEELLELTAGIALLHGVCNIGPRRSGRLAGLGV
ncbi:MAG: hypothetical protein R3349_02775 [Geminicoccaceae bacterium]|nr:hypothetical protein [Geminicoccaceae bacterium]